MKIGDELMWRWYELLSFDVSLAELARMKLDFAAGQLHPREAKLRLARELAARFHDAAAAETAVAGWQAAVRGEADMSMLPLTPLQVPAEGLRIAALLKTAGLAASNGEANRKLAERAVRVDGEVFEDAQRVFLPGFRGCDSGRQAEFPSRPSGFALSQDWRSRFFVVILRGPAGKLIAPTGAAPKRFQSSGVDCHETDVYFAAPLSETPWDGWEEVSPSH